MENIQSCPGCRELIKALQISDRNFPKLSTAIIFVRQYNLPAVFIDIESTFRVNMTRTFTQSTFDNPDAVQLTTRNSRIDMPRLQQLLITHTWACNFIVIIRNINLFFTNQFPLITLWTAVVHISAISSTNTFRR